MTKRQTLDPAVHKEMERWHDECRRARKPCSISCASHVSHPCEKCGQQWERPTKHKEQDRDLE